MTDDERPTTNDQVWKSTRRKAAEVAEGTARLLRVVEMHNPGSKVTMIAWTS
jgi:hypothetical protein